MISEQDRRWRQSLEGHLWRPAKRQLGVERGPVLEQRHLR